MVLVPSINQGYWVLPAVTSLINVVMYMIMFVAFVKLKKTKENIVRPYKVQRGKVGMWLIAGVAFAALIFSFAVGLLPSGSTYMEMEMVTYVIGMLISVLLIILLPSYLLKKFRKESWKLTKEEFHDWYCEEHVCESDTKIPYDE